MNDKKRQVALIVLDGWGYREEKEFNAIAEASIPFFDKLWQSYPHATLEASGEKVGLPKGQAGGSEIGHLVIGAGKPIKSDLVRIDDAIVNQEFENNKAFISLFDHVKKYNSYLHICGLLGPGGIHAHTAHLFASIKAAKESGIDKIVIHVFTDGRDLPPKSANLYLKELEDFLENIGIGFIASATGRFYVMDRDFNWDRFKKAEKAIFHGESDMYSNEKPSALLTKLYEENIVDEHLEPVIFLDTNGKSYKISDNDGVLLVNYRADRARMFSQKLLEIKKVKNLCYVSMTEYDKKFDCLVAFPPENIQITLSKKISEIGLNQLHIAETEKYAHATYFLNGGEEKPYDNESRVMIESRKDIKTPDEAPEMRAKEIVDKTMEFIEKDTNFIFINFANPDLVGHTANYSALVHSIEFLDQQLKRVCEKLIERGYSIIITADHGNAELNFDTVTNEKHTAHTTNPVPFILVDKNVESIKPEGTLADVAPTVLKLFGLRKPKEMTGRNLIY